MKENINFDNSSLKSDVNETELLRKDTKNLIYSLKKNQNAVREQVSKLRDENNQYSIDPDFLDSPKPTHSHNVKYSSQIQEVEANERAYVQNELYQDEDEGLMLTGCKRTFNKSVSFNQYLMGRSASSSNRRSRSVSPHLNKTPAKSILKKQLVEDELSDANSSVSDRDG
jgi:hypothetical protein